MYLRDDRSSTVLSSPNVPENETPALVRLVVSRVARIVQSVKMCEFQWIDPMGSNYKANT